VRIAVCVDEHVTPNPALERTRGSDRGSAMNIGTRAAQRER